MINVMCYLTIISITRSEQNINFMNFEIYSHVLNFNYHFPCRLVNFIGMVHLMRRVLHVVSQSLTLGGTCSCIYKLIIHYLL